MCGLGKSDTSVLTSHLDVSPPVWLAATEACRPDQPPESNSHKHKERKEEKKETNILIRLEPTERFFLFPQLPLHHGIGLGSSLLLERMHLGNQLMRLLDLFFALRLRVLGAAAFAARCVFFALRGGGGGGRLAQR